MFIEFTTIDFNQDGGTKIMINKDHVSFFHQDPDNKKLTIVGVGNDKWRVTETLADVKKALGVKKSDSFR